MTVVQSTAVVCAFWLAACGAASTGVPDATDIDAGAATYAISSDGSGNLVVDALSGALFADRWYQLRPSDWPGATPAPIVGTGLLRRDEDGRLLAMPWVHVDRGGTQWLELSVATQPTGAESSKVLIAMGAIEGASVTLPMGTEQSVGVGDVYFALDLDGEITRMGDAIVALLEVAEVTPKTAVARIVHGDASAAELAYFAQPSRRAPTQEARILAALLEGEVVGPAGLPTLAAGVPALLARYQVSNVSFGGLDVSIDPADDGAIELAAEAAPEDQFGVIVVGRAVDGGLIINAGAWGPSLGRGGSVGILPGGLRVEGETAVVAEAYAPAMVASILAQRGEDARAVYLLEQELARDHAAPTALRFHMREHLAMRYDALGLTTEAMALMTEDIAHGRADADVMVQINALSIRTYLDQALGLPDAAVRDAEELLRLATDVLPPAALLGERLGLARAYLAAGDDDTARARYEAVRSDAAALDDAELALIATAELVQAYPAQDPAVAALAIEELLASPDAPLSTSWRVSLLVSAAELRAAIEDREGALQLMGEAFDLLDDLDGAVDRAYTLRRCARLASHLGLLDESLGLTAEALRIYVEVGDPLGIASSALELGNAQLSAAMQRGGPDGLTLIAAAQDSLMTAWALLSQSAQPGPAAEVLTYVATLRGRVGDMESSDLLFERAAQLAMSCADYALVADILQTAARLAADNGDIEGAATLRQSAVMWAAPRGIELWLPESLER